MQDIRKCQLIVANMTKKRHVSTNPARLSFKPVLSAVGDKLSSRPYLDPKEPTC